MGVQALIVFLFNAYGKTDDKERMAIYVTMLKEVSEDVLGKAIKNIIKTEDFLPPISRILREAQKYDSSIHDRFVKETADRITMKRARINGAKKVDILPQKEDKFFDRFKDMPLIPGGIR